MRDKKIVASPYYGLCSHFHDKCHNVVVCRQGTNINNIVFMGNSHYIDCLIKELGIDNSLGNPAYTSTAPSKEEIVDNRVCFVFLCQALEFQPKMRCWIYCLSYHIVPRMPVGDIYYLLFIVFYLLFLLSSCHRIIMVHEIKNENIPMKT